MNPFVIFLLIAIALGVISRLFMFAGNFVAYACNKASWMSNLQFVVLTFLVGALAFGLMFRGADARNIWQVIPGLFLVFMTLGMIQSRRWNRASRE